MLKPAKIIVLFLLFGTVTWGADQIIAGDLIIPSRNATDWPPVTLTRPDLQCYYNSENFRIHYDTSGDIAVYHPDEDFNPPDGTPDYINRMAEFLETSRYVLLTTMNFDMPPPDGGLGGDERYDIYVTDIIGAAVAEHQSDYYPDRPAYVSFIHIGRDLRTHIHPDDPIPKLMATCAHEYFHAIQMAYRAFFSDSTEWWYELTACWAEDKVFDELNYNYNYLEWYYDKIYRSIYLTDGNHMYGAWVLAEYLSQNHEEDFIRQIFIRIINLDNCLLAIRETLYEFGLDFTSEFSTFAAWNYFTGDNYRAGFFEEGEDFPVTVSPAAEHYAYPTGWMDTPRAVENLGITYIYFHNPMERKANLVIDFKADEDYPEGLTLCILPRTGPVEMSVRRVEADQLVELTVEDFHECDGAVLCINWLFHGHIITDSAGYWYSARIDTIPSAISIAGDVKPEIFSLYGNYPNPFNLSSNIIFEWNSDPIDYTIRLYGVDGRLVDQLSGWAQPGLNQAVWKPATEAPTGVYYYQVTIGGTRANSKMLLLK